MEYYAIKLVLGAVATFYLTYAILYSDGMFDMFKRLRNWRKDMPFDCFICTAFWVGLVVALLAFGLESAWLHALAFAGVAVFIDGME